MSTPLQQPRSKVIKGTKDFTTQSTSGVTWEDSVPWEGTWEWEGDALTKNVDKPSIQ